MKKHTCTIIILFILTEINLISVKTALYIYFGYFIFSIFMLLLFIILKRREIRESKRIDKEFLKRDSK